MTWRRIAPWVIGVVALVAIFIDLPRTTLGLSWLPDEIGRRGVPDGPRPRPQGRPARDARGEPAERHRSPPTRPRDGARHHRAPRRRHRRQRAAGPDRDRRRRVAADRRRGTRRQRPGAGPPARRLDRAAPVHRPAGPAAHGRPGHRPLLEDGTVASFFDGGEIDPSSVAPAVDQERHRRPVHARPEGSDIWCEFTTANVGQPGPIALDGRVITTPNIKGAICGGQTIITVGPPTEENETERTNLYNTLRFGALPISLTEQGVETVDPTLGADFLVQALVAGAIGLVLVLFFMIAYYRLPGVLAAIALIFYTLVVYAIFRLIHVTLTLAGVAAFILSIGMAVDANILIFERMKEEIRAGKTLGPAIEAGFNRAWSSILDSNVSSLLVAGWLYWQGTTVVRGFALVLIIGVLVSMFSAVTVTRTMLRYVTRTSVGPSPRALPRGALGRVRHRRQAEPVVRDQRAPHPPGLLFILLGGLKPSIDFTGGTEWEVRYAHEPTAAEMTRALRELGHSEILVTELPDGYLRIRTEPIDLIPPGDPGAVAVGSTRHRERGGELRRRARPSGARAIAESPARHQSRAPRRAPSPRRVAVPVRIRPVPSPEATPTPGRAGTEFADARAELEDRFGRGDPGVVRGPSARSSAPTSSGAPRSSSSSASSSSSPTCGSASGSGSAPRRSSRSSTMSSSSSATFAILGYFFCLEFDALFVTALLTIIGFSVHDTIVVFDRIRENRVRHAGESFGAIVNHSILQTMGRSIITSLTVVVTLGALLLLGPPTIRTFTLALLLGVVSGTYSSIFNASQILVAWDDWDRRSARRGPPRRA